MKRMSHENFLLFFVFITAVCYSVISRMLVLDAGIYFAIGAVVTKICYTFYQYWEQIADANFK